MYSRSAMVRRSSDSRMRLAKVRFRASHVTLVLFDMVQIYFDFRRLPRSRAAQQDLAVERAHGRVRDEALPTRHRGHGPSRGRCHCPRCLFPGRWRRQRGGGEPVRTGRPDQLREHRRWCHAGVPRGQGAAGDPGRTGLSRPLGCMHTALGVVRRDPDPPPKKPQPPASRTTNSDQDALEPTRQKRYGMRRKFTVR